MHMDTDILPVRLEGLFEIMKRTVIIPKRGPVSVHIGKPFRLKPMAYFKATKEIERRVKNEGRN